MAHAPDALVLPAGTRRETVGPVTLLRGSALDLLAGLPPADLVVTDPPYKLTSGGNGTQVMGGKFARTRYDNSGNLMATVGWAEMAAPIYAALRPDAEAYAMCNDKNLQDCLNGFTAAGFKVHNILAWDKISPTRNRWYMKNLEFIVFLWKGRARTINNPGSKQLFECRRPEGAIHPTQKPVELMAHYIENSSQPGELVLDPFSGSATTLVAAMRTGRRAIGIELDETHFETSLARLRAEWALMQEAA